jgi:hypothetical protein
MAQKTIVQLVDDLDGTASDDIATVMFGLDGVSYEIDLTEGNASNFRKSLEEFVAAARRTGGRIKRELLRSRRLGRRVPVVSRPRPCGTGLVGTVVRSLLAVVSLRASRKRSRRLRSRRAARVVGGR